jgi:dTMP kinase
MNNKRPGSRPHFISFEGGEGAGKTTLMNRLAKLFSSREIPVLKTREPGGTPFGEQLRRWILQHDSSFSFGAKAELLLFLAARAQHIQEKIAPALQQGVLVLCDRFNDSTVAYQGAGRGLGTEWVRSLCALVCEEVQPDLTFYLDLDPTVGLARRSKLDKGEAPNGQLDRIESEAMLFHQRIREAFLLIVKQEPDRFCFLDASQPQEAVFQAALQRINEQFSHV